MNIAEMHVMFRQFAQQMGMQNVRAILPEQIDLCINTSIDDTINELIRTNVGITNDRIITDNSKIGQINALRTLYKVIEVSATPDNTIESGSGSSTMEFPFYYAKDKHICRIIGDFKNFSDSRGLVKTEAGNFKYRFLVDTSISYKRDNRIQKDKDDPFDSNWFPIRIIDDAYLSDSINDFISKPKLRSPVGVVYNDTFDVYIGDLHKTPITKILTDDSGNELKDENGDVQTETTIYYWMDEHLIPDKVRISYIAEPNKVKYVEDIGGTNIDCDLPEYMHADLVKHAVDLYRISITGNMQAAQQQQDNQKRENARNQYRDEGYTQQQ